LLDHKSTHIGNYYYMVGIGSREAYMICTGASLDLAISVGVW